VLPVYLIILFPTCMLPLPCTSLRTGKSTTATRLAELYHIKHISVKDLLAARDRLPPDLVKVSGTGGAPLTCDAMHEPMPFEQNATCGCPAWLPCPPSAAPSPLMGLRCSAVLTRRGALPSDVGKSFQETWSALPLHNSTPLCMPPRRPAGV